MSEQPGSEPGAGASGAINPNLYRLTVSGLRLPVAVHWFFDVWAAGCVWLLGHPEMAVVTLLTAGLMDLIHVRMITRWSAEAEIDEHAGFRKLALLQGARCTVYVAPMLWLAIAGGIAEMAMFAIQ